MSSSSDSNTVWVNYAHRKSAYIKLTELAHESIVKRMEPIVFFGEGNLSYSAAVRLSGNKNGYPTIFEKETVDLNFLKMKLMKGLLWTTGCHHCSKKREISETRTISNSLDLWASYYHDTSVNVQDINTWPKCPDTAYKNTMFNCPWKPDDSTPPLADIVKSYFINASKKQEQFNEAKIFLGCIYTKSSFLEPFGLPTLFENGNCDYLLKEYTFEGIDTKLTHYLMHYGYIHNGKAGWDTHIKNQDGFGVLCFKKSIKEKPSDHNSSFDIESIRITD
jgi:hypothetical protein